MADASVSAYYIACNYPATLDEVVTRVGRSKNRVIRSLNILVSLGIIEYDKVNKLYIAKPERSSYKQSTNLRPDQIRKRTPKEQADWPRRMAVWRHNSFLGACAMFETNLRYIIDSSTATNQSQDLAQDLLSKVQELKESLKTRKDQQV